MTRRARPDLLALAGVLAGAAGLLVAQAAWLPGPAAPGLELVVVRAARAGAAAADAPLTTLLLAPFWRHEGAARAYELSKLLESLLLALTVVPAYFLSRPLVGPRWALGVAAASVLVPASISSAAASPVPLAYPVTTAALLAFVRYLERPRVSLLVTALAACALAGALWPAVGALGIALALLAAGTRPWARALLRWPGAAVWIALAVAAYVAWSALVASSSTAAAADWPHGAAAAVRSVGAVALGLGVLSPLACVCALGRREARAHALALGAAAVALVPAAGIVAAGTGNPADELPLLVLVPLVLTLAVAALRARLVARRAVVAGALVLLTAALANRPREVRTFDPRIPGLQWLRSGGHVSTVTLVATVVLAFVLAGALLLALSPGAGGRLALAAAALALPLPAAVAASVAAEHRAAGERAALPSPPVFLEGVGGPVAVDDAVPPDTLASLLFWNGDARALDPPLSARTVDPGTGVYEPLVTGFRAVLTADPRLARGQVVKRTPLGAVVLVTEPVGAAETVTGVYPDGWSGPSVTYRRFQVAPGASLTITLSRRAFTGPPVPDGITIALGPLRGATRVVRRLRVPTGATRVVRLPTQAQPFRVDLALDTFSPARFGSSDTRELGAQPAFRYGP